MKKITFFIVAVILTIPMFGLALEQTTDKEITTLGVPWYSSYQEFRSSLQESGVVATISKSMSGIRDDNVSEHGSSAYGVEELLPYQSYENVMVDNLTIENKQESGEELTIFTLAGYDVKTISARLLQLERYGDGQIFSLTYFWSDTTYREYEDNTYTGIPYEDQYLDLKRKLSELYGDPYSTEYSKTDYMWDTDTSCSLWVGASNTAVYLKWSHVYVNSVAGRNYALDSISIGYGSTDSDRRMKEIQDAYDEEQRKPIDDALNDIADDKTGL